MPKRISRSLPLVLVLACSDGGGHRGGGTGLQCEGSLYPCNGSCVDLQTDLSNCGTCSNVCAANRECVTGQCISPCTYPMARCDGVHCTNVSVDAANCGACGNPCQPGETCWDAVCGPTCVTPTPNRCGLTCVSFATDSSNCGNCGNACTLPAHCLAGECTTACPASQTNCGGTCVSLTSDSSCGSCTNACGASMVCSLGQCVSVCGGVSALSAFPTVATGRDANVVAVGDLDGDGNPDLVFGNGLGNDVRVALGLGGGRFATPVSYAAGEEVRGLAIADLTGDGKLDVAASVSGYTADQLVVFPNAGSGTLGAPSKYQTVATGSQGSLGIAAADLDGANGPDLAVVNTYDSKVAVFLNQGGGTFPATPAWYDLGSASYAEYIAAGDVTGDGKPDLVVTCTGGFAVLTNQGSGTFPSSPALHDLTPVSLKAISLADMDQDGMQDVVLANAQPSTLNVIVRWNAASSPFAQHTELPLAGTPYALAVVDVTGDGLPDALAGDTSTRSVAVFRNLGGRSFAAKVEAFVGEAPYAVETADLDRDGNRDLVAARLDDVAALLPGKGDGTFAGPTRFPVTSGQDLNLVATADVNGDGKGDVVVATRLAATVGVLLGNGDGTVGLMTTYAAGPYVQALAVADMNGDGWTDIVVSNLGEPITYVGQGIGVLLNNGDGTFLPQVLRTTGGASSQLAVGDVDGDGKLDVLFGYGSPIWGFGIALGNGDGTLQQVFAVQILYQSPTSIAVGDMNGDGTLDVVLAATDIGANPYVHDVVVVKNNGGAAGVLSGRFALGPKLVIPEYGYSLNLVDLNGDLRPDILLADGTAVQVFRAQLNLTFSARSSYPIPTYRFAVADVNGDRRPDLLAATPGGVALSVTSSNGVPGAAVTYPAGPVAALAAGDLDADGHPDVASIAAYAVGERDLNVLRTSCR